VEGPRLLDLDPPHAAVLPDGKWIIYTFMQGSGQSGIQSDIFARTLDGTSEQRLTSTEGRDMQPDWQPLR
jgi:Tol biopolymer transport system component